MMTIPAIARAFLGTRSAMVAVVLLAVGLPPRIAGADVLTPACGLVLSGAAEGCDVAGGLSGLADINPHLLLTAPMNIGTQPCITFSGPGVDWEYNCTDLVNLQPQVVPELLPGAEYHLQIADGWYGEVSVTTDPSYAALVASPTHGQYVGPPLVSVGTNISLTNSGAQAPASTTYWCAEAEDTSLYYDHPALGLGIHEDGTVEVSEVAGGDDLACPASVVSSLDITSTITHHCIVLTGIASGQEYTYSSSASGSKYIDSSGNAHAKASPAQVVPVVSPQGYWCGYGSYVEVFATVRATFSAGVSFGIRSDCFRYRADYGDDFLLIGTCYF